MLARGAPALHRLQLRRRRLELDRGLVARGFEREDALVLVLAPGGGPLRRRQKLRLERGNLRPSRRLLRLDLRARRPAALYRLYARRSRVLLLGALELDRRLRVRGARLRRRALSL